MESFIGLCVLLGVGHFLRTKITLLRKLYLPSSVIAGLLGLLIIQCFDVPAPWTAGWGKLPGFLINIVFACLFLGVTLPSIGKLFKIAGPQLAYGQIVAWGQYVVGIGVVLLVLAPMLTSLPEAGQRTFGGLIPVGFEGGHGTAGGLEETFTEMGWPEGKDFALTSATCGIISAIIVGMILVNWAARRGYTAVRRKVEDIPEDESIGVIPIERRPAAGKLTISADAMESLTLHIAVVGVAVLIGWAIKQGMMAGVTWIHSDLTPELRTTTNLYRMVRPFPVFPLCMIGGLLIQLYEQRFDKHELIDLGLMHRIQGAALDFLVVAAIATIRIEALGGLLVPFAILIGAGILWNVFCVTVLARRVLPDAWFERSIAEMGQSMGVTATGLLLLRVVDPDYKTPAAEAFAAKQVIHEPFMGGGLWTSIAIPLLALWGGWPVFGIALGALLTWLTILVVWRVTRKA